MVCMAKAWIGIAFFVCSGSLIADRAAEFYDAALFERAISEYHDVLQDCDDDAVRYKLAESYFQNNDFRNVIDILEKEPKHTCDLFLLGVAYIQVGSYDQAIEALAKVDSEDARFYKGIACFKAKRMKEARQAFESVGHLILAQINLARMDIEQGEFRSAKLRLERLDKDSNAYEISYLLGEANYHLRDFSNAIKAFEQALPKHNPEKSEWYQDTLYYLGCCYLKMSEEEFRSAKEQNSCFDKAEETFKKISHDEKFTLALGQTYLIKAHRLKNEEEYRKAEALLSQEDLFVSIEAKMKALLLRAQTASSYAERDKLYRQLTQEIHKSGSFYAKGWYLRGLNDFEEGESLNALEKNEEAHQAYERAINALGRAFHLAEMDDRTQAALALKFQAQAYAKLHNTASFFKAIGLLNQLMDQSYLSAMDDPDEVFYLKGLILSYVNDVDQTFCTLKEGLERYPGGNFIDRMFHLEGTLYYQAKAFKEAEQAFLQLVEQVPHSPLAGEALFFAAQCLESREPEHPEIRNLRKRVYEKYPHSPYAAEAYFCMYSYREYLQGSRTAMKHLHGFVQRFQDSPFLLNVHYLIGMDYKHDRKGEDGRWIQKKNLLEAIDSFQSVESAFDDLKEKKLLSKNYEYFVTIRYRAQLERALANMAIAEESQGAKREIYLEYSQDVFKQIIQDFKANSVLANILISNEPYPAIQEESQYGLALSYIKAGQDMDANEILKEMIDRYSAAKITRGYYLSRVRYEQGAIAMRKKDFGLALLLFNLSEDAAKGKILTNEQRLDLWIQQSICLRFLNQFDEAILILSKAINDDAVSGLRLKAMYMRAEIYEQQGRKELARRQWESTSKKGGEWALKAKAKLEESYAY